MACVVCGAMGRRVWSLLCVSRVSVSWEPLNTRASAVPACVNTPTYTCEWLCTVRLCEIRSSRTLCVSIPWRSSSPNMSRSPSNCSRRHATPNRESSINGSDGRTATTQNRERDRTTHLQRTAPVPPDRRGRTSSRRTPNPRGTSPGASAAPCQSRLGFYGAHVVVVVVAARGHTRPTRCHNIMQTNRLKRAFVCRVRGG